jgi:immune inhibitor A
LTRIDWVRSHRARTGEEAGGGAQGADAIWSHRWYVNPTDFGLTGPTVGGQENRAGGARIGNSNYWLGDYTTEPENGGLGVFAHEFGHDLGLPDFYDTAGGENGTAFWTLMSSGSWLSHGAEANEGIGTTPGLMGPEEKLFLGWLDYREVNLGQSGTVLLDPAQDANTANSQAIKVNLSSTTTSKTYTAPTSGQYAWWTGSADHLSESLSRAVPAASRVTVTAKSWYDIESGYDYLYGEYSTDGGNTWSHAGQPVSGSSNGRWTTLRFSYAAGGVPTQFRFRNQTDGGVHLAGAFLDDIVGKSGGTTLFTDDVEQPGAWTATGLWQRSTGTVTKTADRDYLLENRQYVGYDDTLRTGPYQFSYAITAPNTRSIQVPVSHCPWMRVQRRSPVRTAPCRATVVSRSTRSSGPSRCRRHVCTKRCWWATDRRRPSRPWRHALRQTPASRRSTTATPRRTTALPIRKTV